MGQCVCKLTLHFGPCKTASKLDIRQDRDDGGEGGIKKRENKIPPFGNSVIRINFEWLRPGLAYLVAHT